MSEVNEQPFLSYYGSHEIIPVSLGGVDGVTHRRRRLALYRILGLPQSAFRNSTVIEFGPGTGENAVVVSDLRPSSIILVDGNQPSIASIQRLMEDGLLDLERCVIVEADFNEPDLNLPQSDIVLAEGCIPHQFDPIQSLRNVARFVADAGILVITTCDSVSTLSDLCRRLFKPTIVKLAKGDFQSAVRIGADFFASHLSTLPAVPRRAEEWVLDAILHPWTEQWQLPLPMAMAALDDFEFLGSSPAFLADWHWYKEYGDPSIARKTLALSRWAEIAPFMIDRSLEVGSESPFDRRFSEDLRKVADQFATSCHLYWRSEDRSHLVSVDQHLTELESILGHDHRLHRVRLAIRDVRRLLPHLASGELLPASDEFSSWWGRGQQYLSLERAAGPTN